MILVTHGELASSFADRTIFLEQGRLLETVEGHAQTAPLKPFLKFHDCSIPSIYLLSTVSTQPRRFLNRPTGYLISCWFLSIAALQAASGDWPTYGEIMPEAVFRPIVWRPRYNWLGNLFPNNLRVLLAGRG